MTYVFITQRRINFLSPFCLIKKDQKIKAMIKSYFFFVVFAPLKSWSRLLSGSRHIDRMTFEKSYTSKISIDDIGNFSGFSPFE